MKWTALIALAIATPVVAEESDAPSEDLQAESAFVGRYDGGGFEMAMGMEIRANGTFGWGLSVGALDMRANGTWRQEGELIFLTSDPKPVEPEFAWSGLESAATGSEDAPYFRVVWGTNGEEFQYASAQLTCENGKRFYGQVRRDGFPSARDLEYEDELPPDQDPRQTCDVPDTVVLSQSIHRVRSKPFKLADLGWEPGQTVRFAFHPNDLGVADFTGVTGHLKDGKILLDMRALGRDDFSGTLEMRKLAKTSSDEEG